MITSLLAVLITLPFIAMSLLIFNAWKLIQMLRERLQAEGIFVD